MEHTYFPLPAKALEKANKFLLKQQLSADYSFYLIIISQSIARRLHENLPCGGSEMHAQS